jgi:phage tail tape-measure protein
MKELYLPVIDKLTKEVAQRIPDVPADLIKTYARRAGLGGAAALGATGATLGAGVGIAAGPLGAIAGTIPGAVVGALIGFFAGDKIGSRFQDEND